MNLNSTCNRRLLLLLTISMFIVFPAPIGARQDPDQSDSDPAAASPPAPNVTIEERLNRLTPERPVGYFELAEDCLDQKRFDLAVRLFVLAAHLDTPRYGRSACLGIAALAQMQKNPERARQMRAMARMFPSDTAASFNTNSAPNSNGTGGALASLALDEKESPEIEYRQAGALISGFLGFYRTGFGTRALKTLDLDHQTYAILTEYESAVGSISSILEYCRTNTRCDLCQNTLVIELPDAHKIRQEYKNNTGRNQRPPDPTDEFQVCPRVHSYRPQLSPAELQQLLNIETALAGGTKARWGAQLALDRNQTRPILDPAFLPRMLNVDPNRTVYRNGQWQNPATGSPSKP